MVKKTGNKRRRLAVASGSMVVVGLAAFGGIASASSGSIPSGPPPSGLGGHPPGPPTAIGTVKSIGADSFVLTTTKGESVTVDVSSSTNYMDREVTTPTLADLKVGTNAAVFGSEAGSTVSASSVGIGAPPAPNGTVPNGGPGGSGGPGGPPQSPPNAVGTVTSIGAGSLTLTTNKGTTVTVVVSSTTYYRDRANSEATLATAKVGTTVAIFGTETSGTITATTVCIGAPPAGPPAS